MIFSESEVKEFQKIHVLVGAAITCVRLGKEPEALSDDEVNQTYRDVLIELNEGFDFFAYNSAILKLNLVLEGEDVDFESEDCKVLKDVTARLLVVASAGTPFGEDVESELSKGVTDGLLYSLSFRVARFIFPGDTFEMTKRIMLKLTEGVTQ